MGILPDGKAQVTVEYEDDRPVRLDTVIVFCQHEKEKSLRKLEHEIREKVLRPALRMLPPDEDTKILINPSGRFVCGGLDADKEYGYPELFSDLTVNLHHAPLNGVNEAYIDHNFSKEHLRFVRKYKPGRVLPEAVASGSAYFRYWRSWQPLGFISSPGNIPGNR